MNSPESKHRQGDMEVEWSPSFSETARVLLAWKDEGFPEGGLGTEGESEMRSTFVSQKRFEDNPAQLGRIADFAARRMKLDDDGALLKELSKSKIGESMPMTPLSETLPPVEVLSDILRGKYDEIIKSSKVADLEKAYTFALYSFVQIARDSREKMAEVLGQFLVHYDVPESHLYAHSGGVDRAGLEAVPFLMKLCRTAIEKCNLSPLMHVSFAEALKESEESQDPSKRSSEYAFANLGSVMTRDDHKAKPSKVSTERIMDSAPDDSGEWSQVS